MIVVARPGLARRTSQMLTFAAEEISKAGGVVRTATILGDRIMAHSAKAIDTKNYLVGRYIQVLVDCSPDMLNSVRRTLMASRECIRVHNHRIPDYLKEIQDTVRVEEKLGSQETKVIFEQEKKDQFDELIATLRANSIKYA